MPASKLHYQKAEQIGRSNMNCEQPTDETGRLYNQRYVGRLIWNRSKFVKVPGSNRRVARLRPESEWKQRIAPELRIVSDDLWDRVHSRLRGCATLTVALGGMASRHAMPPRNTSSLDF